MDTKQELADFLDWRAQTLIQCRKCVHFAQSVLLHFILRHCKVVYIILSDGATGAACPPSARGTTSAA